MTHDDLERMRQAVAGMTPQPWMYDERIGTAAVFAGQPPECLSHDCPPRIASHDGTWTQGVGWKIDGQRCRDLEGITVLRNAHAIAQERHWWCEPWFRDWIVCDGSRAKILRRDDGTPFVGPDCATPLVEADAYMKGRGR